MAQPGGFITIQVGGLAATTRRLVTWGAQISDLSAAWELIGQDLQQDVTQNFASEGGVYGARSVWAPLAPSTVRERLRQGYGGAHPIMVRSGDLFASLAYRGAPGNVFDVQPDRLRYGSTIKYGKYHQNPQPGSRIPRRQLVGVSWQRQQGIVRRLNDEIQRQARSQGLGGG